jgi:transposase
MKLEAILQAYLPREDRRTKVPTAWGLVLLVKNILFSRKPIYGLGEWATGYAPDLLGLAPDLLGLDPEQVWAINDDRAGRWLGRLFACGPTSPGLAAATHSVQEFHVSLDELHNDSTTVTFHGAYADAAEEKPRPARNTLAITFGHNKDHRPDLKQLLYILTLSHDGGVPVHFRAASGNVTDDQTHRDTRQILCRLAGRSDFLYVADCKLATTENVTFIHGHGGRFVSTLPRTRKEDHPFHASLLAEQVRWRPLWGNLKYSIDHARIAVEATRDGVLPLVTNDPTLSEPELLHAYKRQPLIEKRFSQMKADFQVPPVWLKDVGRIEALLGVHFFALLAEALLERELRNAMEREGIEALPMYPEGRPCRRPTAPA